MLFLPTPKSFENIKDKINNDRKIYNQILAEISKNDDGVVTIPSG